MREHCKLYNYLRGEADLERERPTLRTGERLRLTGDLLGGLRGRLGGGELQIVSHTCSLVSR